MQENRDECLPGRRARGTVRGFCCQTTEQRELRPPIERRKIYELIAEQLLTQIGERRLRPGDPMPTERELTHVYRVGRSSVREALRMLESKGVIEAVGNGSFAVAGYANPLNSSLQLLLTLDQATMRDIYELRRILECEAAALAAERHTDEHLDAMDAAIDEMARGLAVDGPSGRALHRRRPPLPPGDRRGDAERRDPARHARAARADPARADVDLPRPREPRALARAAPRDPRGDRRPATPSRRAPRCARTSSGSSPTSSTRSPRAGCPAATGGAHG